MRHITLIIAVLALAVAAPAIAGKGGTETETGHGSAEPAVAVETSPRERVMHRRRQRRQRHRAPELDADELHGHRLVRHDRLVIGYTDDGTRSIDVPDRTGSTTYEFAGVTYGNDVTKYDVFAELLGVVTSLDVNASRARLMPGPRRSSDAVIVTESITIVQTMSCAPMFSAA